MDHTHTPVNGGDNRDRESVWKWKAEGRLCTGRDDELVDVALRVEFADVVSAKLVRLAGPRRDQCSSNSNALQRVPLCKLRL